MTGIKIRDPSLFNLGSSLKKLERLESLYLYLDRTELKNM